MEVELLLLIITMARARRETCIVLAVGKVFDAERDGWWSPYSMVADWYSGCKKLLLKSNNLFFQRQTDPLDGGPPRSRYKFSS